MKEEENTGREAQEMKEEENTGIKKNKSKAWLVERVSVNSKQYPKMYWVFILHWSTVIHDETSIN